MEKLEKELERKLEVIRKEKEIYKLHYDLLCKQEDYIILLINKFIFKGE